MRMSKKRIAIVSRISLQRRGQSLNLLVEGRCALLIFGAIALAYIAYLSK